MPAAIDTLKLAKRLRQADFTEPQAEALAEAVAEATVENVATKLDIAELRAELKQDLAKLDEKIDAVRTELKQENADLRTELKQEIADLRSELKQEMSVLELKMAAMETRMLRWMGAGFAATIAILAAVVQFSHH